MSALGFIITVLVVVFIAVCFGKIASRHGKDPLLYGILSVIPPINLITLGLWAFSKSSQEKVSTGEGGPLSETPNEGKRETGTVKWFNPQKGYGFIVRESGDEIFVHHSGIAGEGFRTLNEGDRVEFTVKEDKKGPRATDVRKL